MDKGMDESLMHAFPCFFFVVVVPLLTIYSCHFSLGTPTSEQAPSAFGDDDNEHNSNEPPTVVVYIVNPFTTNSRDENVPSSVGLLRCIAEIAPDLAESKKNVIFQV